MRPDSIEIPPEPIKPEPVSRVKPARGKEREERQEEFEELARKNAGERRQEDTTENPAGPGKEVEDSPGSSGGKSCTKGRRLDLLV